MVLLTKSHKRNIIILQSNEIHIYCNFINNWRGNKEKMSVILPWVGGFVEGGMVDGSIDRITKKHFYFKI